MFSERNNLETHVYYDFPRFFTYDDEKGQKWAWYWMDDRDEKSIWLVKGTSEEELEEVLNNGIDLRTFLSSSESGVVYKVIKDFEEVNAYNVTSIDIEKVEENFFIPNEGIFFKEE